MKKIRIVTFHRAMNYGAMLQSYALENFLINEKIEAKILDYRNPNIEKGYKLLFKYNKNNSLKNNVKDFIINLIFLRRRIKRHTEFKRFIKEELILTDKSYNYNELMQYDEKIDCLITGSDQVWNPNITMGLDDIYALNFGKNVKKRFSYAASIGNKDNIGKYSNQYSDKLKRLNAISLREEDGKQELENLLNKNIEVVLDPTFLLNKNEWENLTKKSNLKIKDKYILAYYVDIDEEYKKILQYLSEKTGLKIIEFDIRKRMNNILSIEYDKGPIDFLQLIKNAELVVTTSFHATVFSVIFEKKFWVIPHKTTGSRMINLLNKLNLSSQLVNDIEEFKKIDYNKEIDYKNTINKLIELESNKSRKWIIDQIEGEKDE